MPITKRARAIELVWSTFGQIWNTNPICLQLTCIDEVRNRERKRSRRRPQQRSPIRIDKDTFRYWGTPIGTQRAKPMSFVERGFREQYCNNDSHRLNSWTKRTIQNRQGRLRGKLIPPAINQIWKPEAHITMGSDKHPPPPPPETV